MKLTMSILIAFIVAVMSALVNSATQLPDANAPTSQGAHASPERLTDGAIQPVTFVDGRPADG